MERLGWRGLLLGEVVVQGLVNVIMVVESGRG
jgi:hypothetical protein